MNRRAFVGSLVGGVAAVRTWPFRMYSFPTEPRIFSMDELRRLYVDRAMAEIDSAMANSQEKATILCSLPEALPPLIGTAPGLDRLYSLAQSFCENGPPRQKREFASLLHQAVRHSKIG